MVQAVKRNGKIVCAYLIGKEKRRQKGGKEERKEKEGRENILSNRNLVKVQHHFTWRSCLHLIIGLMQNQSTMKSLLPGQLARD